MAKAKLDKDGFILPLAIGALALIFFGYYFFVANKNGAVAEPPIQSTQDLDTSLKSIDSQNPDSFSTDLNTNASDASSF